MSTTRPEYNQPEFQLVGICHKCIHRRGLETCDAFPDGIPSEVLVGNFLHTKPYPNDGGIQFEKAL